jgi:hypothetical protein
MNKRTMDEMIAYFNQEVSNMDISQENKIKLLGMITAIGYDSKKQEIVQCKECKKWFASQSDSCGNVIKYYCVNGIHPSDWFCADGERKCGE